MSASSAGDATGLLIDWSHGDDRALERLTPMVYDELHRLAAHYLRGERPDHTLQTTALVNEAYMRLIDQRRIEWRSSLQFVGLAAQMMRRILIDHARSHRSAKRGDGAQKLSLDDTPQISGHRPAELLAVDEALGELAERDPQLARLVELRFFGGLNSEEIAEVLGVSVPTVTRRWRMAKAWLYRYLSEGTADER